MPNSDKLTKKQKINEYVKCAQDPVYYLNNYGYIFDAKKQAIAPLKCFSYQERCIEEYNSNRNCIVLKSRQTGISVITAGYVAWKALFSYDEMILVIANDSDGAIRFLDSIRQFIDYTPEFLKPDERTKNNQKQIQFSNNSEIKAKASSPDAGRGESLTMLIMDEAAFIEHANDIWIAAGMALSATQGKTLMISTPNGTGNLYHRKWADAYKGKNDFKPIKVHWTENPRAAEGLQTNVDEEGNVTYWSPWYEREKQRLNHDSVKIAQELDLSFEGSKRLVFDPEIVSKYEKKTDEIEPQCYLRYKIIENEAYFTNEQTDFFVWKKPEEGRKYLMGCDVARGDGGDYSTIQIIDVDSLEQVAEFQQKIPVEQFPYLIKRAADIYNEAFVVVEANNFGLAVCFDLKNKLQHKKLYESKNVKDIHVRPYNYKVDQGQKIPGFQTTKRTRPLIIKSMASYMREGELKLNSKRLVQEFNTFIMNNERPEHESGYNDDLIFAMAIALYIRENEYENIVQTKEKYKKMLESMMIRNEKGSFRLADGKQVQHNNNKEEKEEKQKKKAAPLYVSKSNKSLNDIYKGQNDDEKKKGERGDDDSWLLGN